MNEQLSTCQFLGKKIKKVTWQKAKSEHSMIYSGGASGVGCDRFCTGSWDDGSNNEIAMWRIETEGDSIHKEHRFVKCAAFLSCSSIFDLQFVSPEKLLYSSTDGDLTLLEYGLSTATFRRINRWNNLHEAPCTSFSFFGDEIVSAGEDGLLNIVNINRKESAIIHASTGSAQFYCVDHFGAKEIAAGNAVGQLQLFDIRHNEVGSSCKTLLPANDKAGGVTSVRCHPSQRHLAVVGHQSGQVAFWDLRRCDGPTAVLAVNNGPIWDIKFHAFYPNNVFTASNDGSLIHWDISSVQRKSDGLSSDDVWLVNEVSQKKLKLTNLLAENVFSVNSLSVAADCVLCSTDNEAVWLLNNLKFS